MSDKVEPPAIANALGLTTSIVAAYVGNNPIAPADLPNLIRSVHGTLNGLGSNGASDAVPTDQKPAVPVKKSVFPDYIVCLEDGKKLTMLKRYIRSRFKLSPEEYRTKWGLPPDYPIVAPNYSKRRSDFAKKIGLGRKRTSTSKKRKRQ